MASNILLPFLEGIRVPMGNEKIYKDECIFSFDTPDSPDGIYVCLRTFLGFSRRFVEMYHQRTGSSVFLNIRRVAHPVKKSPESGSEEDPIKPKVTRLALNVEGGFQTNTAQFEYEDINTIVLLPGFIAVELNQPDLDERVVMSVTGILSADSAARQAELEAMKNTWDGEKRLVSKHADTLVQLNNGVKVPPLGWKCQNCDKRDTLWLNLSDGAILCGRKYFDGTGGNNHAEEHYKATKYPLVVKLGTISANGADVFSYEEDNMVEDPKLAAHLLHWGINISTMQKTEKSMIEMEIDLNQRYDEWSIIQEDGCKLKSLFGPGFTGLVNLGNSCYLNSIMQVIFSIPDFVNEFYRPEKTVQFAQSNHADPTGDLRTQLMKLASGLLSGEYATPSPTSGNEQPGIKPRMFKSLIGRNHPEFASKRQQDAQEFLLHVIDAIERLPKPPGASGVTPTDAFKFEVEERVQCGQSGAVKYKTRSDFLLALPILDVPVQNKAAYDEFLVTKAAVEAAGGKIESDQVIRPIVKMTDCFQAFAHDQVIEDFYSSAIKGKTTATQRIRMKTFPDYLIVQMKKFTLGADWTPKKLDVALDAPEHLDLEYLRAHGLQPGEALLPEEGPATGAAAAGPVEVFEANTFFVAQLKDMGFDENGCRRALYHTKNVGVEPAMNWIFEHMNDADFAAPFVPPSAAGAAARPAIPAQIEVNPEALVNLLSMGIEERHARLGLKLNNNNAERAIEWIFSNIDNMDTLEREEEGRQRAAQTAASTLTPQTYRDGRAQYELVALVSHMGQSTLCGHYVAHIRKTITPQTTVVSATPPNASAADPTNQTQTQEPPSPPPAIGSTQWTIFNDSKVAVSEKPPLQFAYLYLYKRLPSN